MTEFKAKSLCILGRQPALGLAELESLYGPEHIKPLEGAALLDIEAGEINFNRLGGTIKVAQVLANLPGRWPAVKNFLLKEVPVRLKEIPGGKFTLGLSVYGLQSSADEINRTALAIKKAAGRPMRVVPNKAPALNSAQVLHNQLTRRGAWELLIVRDGPRAILAQTFFVQDIEAYGARDQARPKRDSRVGMLPPKLAQIIINLAIGPLQMKKPKVRPDRFVVLDPFCGTGVILQEALLMGYRAAGTDIDPRMVEYAQANLKWLYQKQPQIISTVNVELADATSYQWPAFSALASETYLGRPLAKLPSQPELKKITNDVNTILSKFLINLAEQVRPGHLICLAVPAWRDGQRLLKLPLIDRLTDMGYNIHKFKHVGSEDLIYFRENQIVARQLIVIGKGSRK